MFTSTNLSSSSYDSDIGVPAHYQIRQRGSPSFFDSFFSDSSDDEDSFSGTPTNENATFDLRGALAVANHVKSPAVNKDKASPSEPESSDETVRGYFSRLLLGPSSPEDDIFDFAPLSDPFDDFDDLSPINEFPSTKNFAKTTARPTKETKLESDGITYIIQGVLGNGSFGEVVYALSSLGEQVAIKICPKAAHVCNPSLVSDIVMNERDILVKIAESDQPFLTQPLACFQDDDNVYFVMRLYAQNLAQLVFPLNAQPLKAHQVKLFAAELLIGMQSLHNLGIVHRDLKPDNILITPNGHLAIADFGLSKQFFSGSVRPHMKMFERWGTNGYFAPELIPHTCITEGYTSAVDVWGYGIILYEIILGKRCVHANTSEGQMYMNKQLPDNIHGDISRRIGRKDMAAADLLHAILQADPKCRPSWAAIQQHEYFADLDWEAVARREGKCDVPLATLSGLKPYMPQAVINGEKFQVPDCLVEFESARSERTYSDNIHGRALVQ